MKLRPLADCRYALLVPTSMGVRISPWHGQPVHTSNIFFLQATSAETNVASIPASLGLPVKVLTNFVRGSPIARLIQDNLRSRGLHFEGPEVEQGGPWGYRHQFNIADSGMGARGPRVHNDRAGEVGQLLSANDFDLERIFSREGVRVLHLSGLIASLSPTTGRFCLELARQARLHGTAVSFDLNYRASFWKGREKELRSLFLALAEQTDILAGNEEDFQLCLGLDGPETGGCGLAGKIASFQSMMATLQTQFPQASVFATTLREVEDANRHYWGAVLFAENRWYVVQPRPVGVLDRIGGGDAFMGGLLYGLLRDWEPEKWLHFGWACGAFAVTCLTDYAQPADEAQIWSIWNGNARVQR